jgi:ABC-type branched-subunit amino acid transport system permease subunit
MTTETKAKRLFISEISGLKEVVSRNQVFITLVAFLYLLPLFTKAELSGFRSTLFIITELMIFGIFALSFEFQLGRAGLLNFGQAAFFGLGAYVMAFFLKPSVFPSPIDEIFNIPNLIQQVLPFPLYAFFPIIIIIPLLFATFTGFLLGIAMGATTSRMKGTAFAFIALAIAMVIYEVFRMRGMEEISGGETGLSIGNLNPAILSDWFFYLVLVGLALIVIILFFIMVFLDFRERKHFLLFNFGTKGSALDYREDERTSLFRHLLTGVIILILFVALLLIILPNILDMYFNGETFHFEKPNNYYLVLTMTILCYIFVQRVVNSPYGRVLAAIAQNDDRVEAMGYNVLLYRISAVAISGGLAALAGALFVPYKITIDTEITLSVFQTIDAMIYAIIGGLGTILGPFLGAGIVRFSELRLVDVLQAFSIPGDFWLVFLGIIYVAIVLFFPWGIVGTLKLRSRGLVDNLRKWFNIRGTDYWWISLGFAFIVLYIMLYLTDFMTALIDLIT